MMSHNKNIHKNTGIIHLLTTGIGIVLLLCLFSCSPSNKDIAGGPHDADTTLFSGGKTIISPVDSVFYFFNSTGYLSGRIHVTLKIQQTNKVIYEHDYYQFLDNSKYRSGAHTPSLPFWLDRYNFMNVTNLNYKELGLTYTLWSIVDIQKKTNKDYVYLTGNALDTTFLSLPIPWFGEGILATMTIKGTNKAVVFNRQYQPVYSTIIQGNSPMQPYIYGESTLPLSNAEYIFYKSFPALITRSHLNGTDIWKASLIVPYNNALAYLKSDFKKSARVNKDTLIFTLKGVSKLGSDTTVNFKINVETGATL